MSNPDTSFFGHPRGLSTLFFTEMWERFSFYGLRAILILFMTAAAAKGGMGFAETKASAVIGMFLGSVYLTGLVGGWFADNIVGMRLAVLYGGIGIALGNAAVAIPGPVPFYIGLVLIAFGTGFLKPNVSAIVGTLYAPEDTRRDAGFSIYYMGINLGAFIAPIICGYLGQKIDYHLGFIAAAVGMLVGVVQYMFGWKRFGPSVEPPPAGPKREQALRKLWVALGIAAILAGAVYVMATTGLVELTAEIVSDAFGLILVVIVIGVFAVLLLMKGWTSAERKRLIAIFGFFVAATIFWSLFEQAASTLSLFADRNSDNRIWGWEFPSSFYQILNSLFIIGLAPAMGWLWVKLGKREPSVAAKFSIGLLLAALGYLVLVPAAGMTANGAKVTPWFLTMTYLFHSIGELCLSPVGMSAFTRLTPSRIAGLTMGIWFMSIAAGNYLAGKVSSFYTQMSLTQLFTAVTAVGLAVAVLMFILRGPIERLSASSEENTPDANVVAASS